MVDRRAPVCKAYTLLYQNNHCASTSNEFIVKVFGDKFTSQNDFAYVLTYLLLGVALLQSLVLALVSWHVAWCVVLAGVPPLPPGHTINIAKWSIHNNTHHTWGPLHVFTMVSGMHWIFWCIFISATLIYRKLHTSPWMLPSYVNNLMQSSTLYHLGEVCLSFAQCPRTQTQSVYTVLDNLMDF